VLNPKVVAEGARAATAWGGLPRMPARAFGDSDMASSGRPTPSAGDAPDNLAWSGSGDADPELGRCVAAAQATTAERPSLYPLCRTLPRILSARTAALPLSRLRPKGTIGVRERPRHLNGQRSRG
jgi:hypothetical protein